MIDAIIDMFFCKKTNKPLTYLSREKSAKRINFVKKSLSNYNGAGTELSEYFSGSLGLNMTERALTKNEKVIKEYNLR